MPWDDTGHAGFVKVEANWRDFQSHWIGTDRNDTGLLTAPTTAFVSNNDALVSGIEAHMSTWTATLHLL